jgi:hypothetical protein
MPLVIYLFYFEIRPFLAHAHLFLNITVIGSFQFKILPDDYENHCPIEDRGLYYILGIRYKLQVFFVAWMYKINRLLD